MPKFLYEAHYTPDGAKGIIKDGGSARRSAIAAASTPTSSSIFPTT